MKRAISLFLALLMALTSLPGCGSNVEADADTNVEAAPAPREDRLSFQDLMPKEVHDMDTASLISDYLSGAWDGHPVRSEDGSVTAGLCAEGYLSYHYYYDDPYQLPYIFYDIEALPMVKRVTAGEDQRLLPEDWQGERIYLDLPGQRLPEDALDCGRISGVGTCVQTPEGVTLYSKENTVNVWEIPVEEDSLLSVGNGFEEGFGNNNYVRADDKFFRLSEGGKMKLLYDHVIDVGTDAAPDYVILTLDDGTLTVYDGLDNHFTSWSKKVIAKDVAEARLVSNGVGSHGVSYRTNDGEAFAVFRFVDCFHKFPAYAYDLDVKTVAYFGQRTLDEVNELWESMYYSHSFEPGATYYDRLRDFLEEYSKPEPNTDIAA